MPHGDLINNISRRLLWEHQQEIPWERVTVVGEGPWIFLQGEKYEMLFESHVVQYSTGDLADIRNQPLDSSNFY